MFIVRCRSALFASLLIWFAASPATALDAAAGTPPTQVTALSGVKVSAPAPFTAKSQADFPATQASISAERIEATVNAVDAEDAAKYLPSLFIRKRNYGDTQPVLATRMWGVNASARTLVYIDDVPISTLIANDNIIGAPRWGMAPAASIDRIDMLYGPFSAAYSGNAMGGVMRITTRLPDKPQVTIKQTEAVQNYSMYGLHDHFSTSQTSLSAASRHGPWGWSFTANTLNSFSQPLSYITRPNFPAGTFGATPARNSTGQPANVLGAGGLQHARMLDLNGRVSYVITPWLQASYSAGYWNNHGHANDQTLLTDAAGRRTFGDVAGFANLIYGLDAHHLMQAASLKTDSKGDFDGEAVITHYAFLKDSRWNPATVGSGTDLAANGRLTSYAGTNWSTADLRGTWRPEGYSGTQEVSIGVHGDRYELDNSTTNLTDWRDPASTTTLYAAGSGKTVTHAVWMQHAWRFAPAWLLTVGGRYEWWRASDGFNFSGRTAMRQPAERSDGFSPKATLQWSVAPDWRIIGSLAKSIRFPTVGELYQLVTTGDTFTSPNPDLKAERALDGELAIEHTDEQGLLRLSLFQENTRDALTQQTAFLAQYPAPVYYVLNVNKIRNRGIELVAQRDDVLVRGLELSGSITYVNSTVVSDDNFASASGTTAAGKRAPYIPRLRITTVATYRPNDTWTFTLAGRYSGHQYLTLDNTDNTPRVFGAFDKFVVFDTRVQYRIDEHLTVALGIDNLNNEKYFLYHPFPQRTYVADLKITL